MAGPKNELVRERAKQLLLERQLPPVETIGAWRTPPDAREYARRYQVWELLAWDEHDVLRPNRGLRGFLRRLWYRLTGQKHKLLSPWEQLRIGDHRKA
ncbi:MAG TPA: hypothetical protein VK966_04950, partial [Longimicrobiales bacterium]|nr:hypothetical protein [Longimicrobiales bacterium]